MAERYDNIFEVKEGDKVKIDGSDTEYTVIKVNVQDGIILKDSNGEIERKRTPEKISKIDYTSSTQTSSTNNGNTSTTSTAATSPTSPVQLEKNSSVGFTRDPKSDDYVGDYVADNVTVEQETINKVINGENPNTVSQNEVKARTPDPNIPYVDTTDSTNLAKEAKTAQVTGLNDLDEANIKKGGLFNWFKGTEKGVSDITGTDALYDISHNSDGSYDFKDVKTGAVYKVKQDANGNYVAYDQNNKPLNKGTSVSLNLQRVTKISDLSTNGNGLDNTPGSMTKGFVDIGNGEQEYSIISNGNGTYTFIDSGNNGYTVTYDPTTKKVTVIDIDNNSKKQTIIDDKDLSLRDEHYLWNDTTSGTTTYNKNSGIFQGGTTDISRVGDSVFGSNAANYYYEQNAQEFSGQNSFDNFGAKEKLTDYNTLEPIVNRTVANIHDYGTNTTFKSREDAALALSRNGTFSYTEAKTIVDQALAGGTTDANGNIITADFTFAPQTIEGKVEFYADPVNSFITDYDQKWEEYINASKADIEKIKTKMTNKVESIRSQCKTTLANINQWINDAMKGNGASATLNALECIKGKIENLYNNINDKIGEAIKTLEDLDTDMKDLKVQEGYRVNYATEIQKLRTEMKSCNGASDYTVEPDKTIFDKYKYYNLTGKEISEKEWNALAGPDRGSKTAKYKDNTKHGTWVDDMQKHTELMEKLKALVEYYEPLQDKINEEINFIINFGTTIDSFDTFLKNGNDGGYLSSAQAIFNNHETIMRELTNFAKYPVITDKDIDFPDGMIVYMDDDPNHKYIVNGRGWDENGHYIIVEAIDPVTGKVIEGTSRRVYDVREVSKPTGWNDPVYKTTAPQDIPVGTTAPPSGTTAPPKGPVGPAGTTAPPKGPVGPSGTTAPPGTVAPVGTTAPPTIPTTKPSTIPPTTRPTVVPTVRPTVIPTVIPTIPSVIPDIDDPVGPAIPTLPPIPTPPTTPGPFIPHTGLENFASSKETNESSLGLAGLAGLGLGALGLGAAAMSSDKEEDEEESKEEKEDKKQENVNKDFPNAWNHTVENNSEHIQ